MQTHVITYYTDGNDVIATRSVYNLDDTQAKELFDEITQWATVLFPDCVSMRLENILDGEIIQTWSE